MIEKDKPTAQDVITFVFKCILYGAILHCITMYFLDLYNLVEI